VCAPIILLCSGWWTLISPGTPKLDFHSQLRDHCSNEHYDKGFPDHMHRNIYSWDEHLLRDHTNRTICSEGTDGDEAFHLWGNNSAQISMFMKNVPTSISNIYF
jgi:hypothetical protein